MPQFRIRGRVATRVVQESTEYTTIDMILDANNSEAARDKVLTLTEEEYWHADQADAEWYLEPQVELIVETDEEIVEKERVATYMAMVALNAPRLPGMEHA